MTLLLLCGEKNMNIYSISISHGKNSSHITYIRLNHPWSINRLRTKALDWLREWLTAERVEPLNVKLKGKMGSVFVQVPWGEKPGFRTHTCTRTHVHTRTHLQHTYAHILWSCSTLGCAPHESILCFLLFETCWVSLCHGTLGSAEGHFCVEQVRSYPSSAPWPWWITSFGHYSHCFHSLP